MTAHISPTDLTVLDAEPRVQDLRLAEALDFSQPYDIRQLIKRNAPELAKHGEVFGAAPKTSPNGGRPTTEYWLNEPQSLLICMFSRTDKAAEVRGEIIRVFMEWRKGHNLPAIAAPVVSTADSLGGDPLPVVTAKLSMVRESRLIHGVERARILWDRLGLPAVPGGPEIAVADGRACLAHLLGKLDANIHLRVALRAAMNDDADAQARLREHGIRIMEDQDGFVIANNHARVIECYRNSKWGEGRHVPALKSIPGAHRVPPMKFSNISAYRGVFIPIEAVELSDG